VGAEAEKKVACPVCGEVVEPRGKALHFRQKHPDLNYDEYKDKWEAVVVGPPPPAPSASPTQRPPSEVPPPPPPPEVQIIEEAIKFVEDRLPKVYGIEKYAKLIAEELRDNPAPLRDPNLLYAFIKSIAPRASDAHLNTFVIAPLYTKFPNLPQMVDRHLAQQAPPASPAYPAPVAYMPYQPYYYPYHYPYAHAYPHTYYPHPYQPLYPPPYPPRPPKTYKVVVDGQEIETDEAGYMAWQRFLKEREEHEMKRREWEMRMKALEEELKRREDKVPVKIGDKEYLVPVSYAHLYLRQGDDETKKKLEELSKKLEEEREARHRAELEALKKDLEELKRRPSVAEELAYIEAVAQRLGYTRGGRTTIDLIDALSERLDRTAQRLIEKIPGPSREWSPEVRRTPEERAKKAEEIKRKLEKGEEILKAEEELIRAAAKVKPRPSQSSSSG
jgi:hypothetical protein